MLLRFAKIARVFTILGRYNFHDYRNSILNNTGTGKEFHHVRTTKIAFRSCLRVVSDESLKSILKPAI